MQFLAMDFLNVKFCFVSFFLISINKIIFFPYIRENSRWDGRTVVSCRSLRFAVSCLSLDPGSQFVSPPVFLVDPHRLHHHRLAQDLSFCIFCVIVHARSSVDYRAVLSQSDN